jgi:prepilin-type N-terminal cleavage/methylation domain-containing protein
MSLTGISGPLKIKKRNKTGKGFTLIEVIIATMVLSFGILLVYEGFFKSLEAFNYYNKYFKVSFSVNETMWQAQDELSRFGELLTTDTGILSDFIDKNRDAARNLSNELMYEIDGKSFYRIDFLLTWNENGRRLNIKRTGFAVYAQE